MVWILGLFALKLCYTINIIYKIRITLKQPCDAPAKVSITFHLITVDLTEVVISIKVQLKSAHLASANEFVTRFLKFCRLTIDVHGANGAAVGFDDRCHQSDKRDLMQIAFRRVSSVSRVGDSYPALSDLHKFLTDVQLP